jgi:hypothetical protein
MTLITKSSSWVATTYCPLGSKKGVVRGSERLAGTQITGARELPDDVAGRIHLE